MGIMLNDCHGAFLQSWCFMLFSQKWLPSEVSICYLVILSSQYLRSIVSVFFFLQSISADSSGNLFVDGEFAMYLPTVSNWQMICMHCLFSGTGKWWICRTNNFMNLYTNSWCCIFSVLYCLYNTIHVLGPFFSVLVSPFSVGSIL